MDGWIKWSMSRIEKYSRGVGIFFLGCEKEEPLLIVLCFLFKGGCFVIGDDGVSLSEHGGKLLLHHVYTTCPSRRCRGGLPHYPPPGPSASTKDSSTPRSHSIPPLSSPPASSPVFRQSISLPPRSTKLPTALPPSSSHRPRLITDCGIGGGQADDCGGIG